MKALALRRAIKERLFGFFGSLNCLLLQEDLLIHGDSVYDIIDKQDHASIQSELMRGLQPETSSSILDNGNEKRIFLCRMNVSRNARRQMRFGDQKVQY